MEFKEKYTTQAKIDKIPKEEKELLEKENKKQPLSNDAYAIGEMIENLINKIEHARVSSLR